MTNTYKDLLFWQSSYLTTKLIYTLGNKIDKKGINNILLNQVFRSSASVGANIAEGYGRYKGKEYSRFIQISLGSASETDYWLTLMKDLYPQFESEVDVIIEKNMESIKMLSKTLKKLSDKSLNH